MRRSITQFDLDADVTVSQLRTTNWQAALRRFGRLRVQRRGRGEASTVGILVTPETWRAITEALDALEQFETAQVATLIDARSGSPLETGDTLAASILAHLAMPPEPRA